MAIQIVIPAVNCPRPHASVYEIVTQRIIEQLEAGVAPWRKPWKVRMLVFCAVALSALPPASSHCLRGFPTQFRQLRVVLLFSVGLAVEGRIRLAAL